MSATRKNKKGETPLIYRITYEGKRKQFATGLFINPDHWHSK
ncbi:Arm DNA-binding domain-containing protein [Galbibacter sp. EGI 63066]|nr:Arm DNA-binding domain-containing protein [Galbibacter sp. EGI 63066]MCX2678913.1 Arm DNA-binding domain-containing protein [Galbibacter sp. EGI 63066]